SPTLVNQRTGPRMISPGPVAFSLRSLRGRSGRNRDRSALDLLGDPVELTLDVVDEPAGRGIADAVGLEVECLDAARELALDEVADRVVDGDVHALEVRREDEGLLVGRRGRVLVRVRALGPDVRRAGRAWRWSPSGPGQPGRARHRSRGPRDTRRPRRPGTCPGR